MPAALTRVQRYQQFLEDVDEPRREEARESAPDRFAVLEYGDGKLSWIYTQPSLAACQLAISQGSCLDVAVMDLDTGKYHSVAFEARIAA